MKTKPSINDYPITDQRTYLNFSPMNSVNWEKFSRALDKYIIELDEDRDFWKNKCLDPTN